MSQAGNVDTVASGASALFHEVFVNEIKPHLAHLSPVAGLFNRLGAGQYRIDGEKLVFAGDLNAAPMGQATDGYLPDHISVDTTSFETTPARSYLRKAVDNFTQARGKGPGVFEDYMARQKRQAVEGWERMTTFQVHGDSNGTLAKIDSVTSTTVIVLKDGYGHAGTNPVMFLDKNQIIAVLDVSASNAVLGASKISSVDWANKTITLSTAIAGMAADDLIVLATTTDTAATRFKTNRGNQPLGLRNLLDPDSASSSYLGVTESTNQRVKPVRKTSADWGEVEFMEFRAELRANGQSPVTRDSHVFSCQEGIVMELAKTLVGYTQIQQKGKELAGGWETVTVAGHDFLVDDYHTHDELMAHCLEDYFVVDLGDAEVFDEDGSEFSRIPDFDGKEWFMRYYNQRILDRRNRSGTLKGLTNSYADTFAPVPR